MASINFSIEDPSQIIGVDLGRTVIRGIYKGTESLSKTVVGLVVDKTPYITHGLQDDEFGTWNNDPSNPELIHVYTETANQIANWGRVYVQYVEGGELGHDWEKDGKGPKEMFARTAQELPPILETWGSKGIQSGIDDILSGRGLRL